MRVSGRANVRHLLSVTLVAILALGCSGIRPANKPLEQPVDPDYGYRPTVAAKNRDSGRIWLYLAFSGGGTRAAALAYGVLEGLRDTEVVIDGKKVRLLDEVDTLSGVSGGSFPASYYALFEDRIFDEFEERFLRRDVQSALFWRILNPWNLIRLPTPYLSRSEIASNYYSGNVFDGATFADLAATKGPRAYINATDLPSGFNFRFSQEAFDVICSDLNQFPISWAVAASSAVPGLLSPVTLKNYAGSCGYQSPEWYEEALRSRATNPRGWRVASFASKFLDADEKKFIHLVDGGISDNLGVRAPLDRIAAIGGIVQAVEYDKLELPDQLVVVVVNAETEPDPKIDLRSAAPSLAASLNLVSGSQIRRYNFESLLLINSSVEDFSEELSRLGKPVSGRVVEVSFDLLEDEEERHYFKQLPTSFRLDEEQVDRLIEVGQRLLKESPQFQSLLEELR